jgi:hypothetical protein
MPAETATYPTEQRGWVQIAGNHDRKLATKMAAELIPFDAYAYTQVEEGVLKWIASLPP